MSTSSAPRVSVIIPTYNRCQMLDQALLQLTRQTVPAGTFEVVVSDDGSGDETKAVVDSYADRLAIRYSYQEDLGHRVALARNAGARLATGQILVFLDNDALAGPDFIAGHLEAHAGPDSRAVAGYVYGYDPRTEMPGLAQALASASPAEVVARLGSQDGMRDMRYDFLAECDFDLNRFPLPYAFFWTMNCSIRSEDFWAVGGFDEDFQGWGLEDTEFAFRVDRKGIPFYYSQRAWIVHLPRERDLAEQADQLAANAERFFLKHPEPVIEIGWALITRKMMWLWRPEYLALRQAQEQAPADVADEIAAELAGCAAGESIAIFGSGARLPDAAAPAYLIDYDDKLLGQALRSASAKAVGHHAIGLRTPFADQSVGTVIITSRLDPLWQRWGTDILAEAQRVGRTVRVHGTT
jgi:glycosyltransferase involved in cell wall biosynthesis